MDNHGTQLHPLHLYLTWPSLLFHLSDFLLEYNNVQLNVAKP